MLMLRLPLTMSLTLTLTLRIPKAHLCPSIPNDDNPNPTLEWLLTGTRADLAPERGAAHQADSDMSGALDKEEIAAVLKAMYKEGEGWTWCMVQALAGRWRM